MKLSLLCLLLVTPCLLAMDSMEQTCIAITIDDYPMGNGLLYSLEERTNTMLATLDQHKCTAAFFCIGSECVKQPGALNILKRISDAGHPIANHSWSHTSLSKQTLDQFEQEVTKTQATLQPYPTVRQWYRYPYLDYGQRKELGGSLEKAHAAATMLQAWRYTEGFVTINTFDWHINSRLVRALKDGKMVDYSALGSVYRSLLTEWASHYIELYHQRFGNNIDHTLLLHANDLNAFYLDSILDLIKKQGWQIITPNVAFSNNGWRQRVFQNPELLADCKPATLDIEQIDSRLLQAHVFTQD